MTSRVNCYQRISVISCPVVGVQELGWVRLDSALSAAACASPCARRAARTSQSLHTVGYTSSAFQLILILPIDSDQSLGLSFFIITLPLSSLGRTAQNTQYNAFTMYVKCDIYPYIVVLVLLPYVSY